ncbi:hypothetical protein [Streptomyces edwardsiae]|uniref:Uncharacterized protein n=1 Tax=Streptomyces edwardsiae TaxID=3075527 RepID=A0ABU2QAR4_9ACTN|nr:hypothetical protein [Streptomyces sp. DSM 41635]MDT0401546.1 hypothetical protein [Streptomyces sp. DSM 41635]
MTSTSRKRVSSARESAEVPHLRRSRHARDGFRTGGGPVPRLEYGPAGRSPY